MSGEEKIDWDRVERWTAQMVADEFAPIAAEFSEGARAAMTWNPAPETFVSDKLRFLLSYWNMLRGGAAMPSFRAVDPLEMRPVLGYVMLLEPIQDGHDFRYRLFGSVIARVSEIDMTGQCASALIASRAVVELGVAAYRAVYRRRQPLYVVRSPIGAYQTAEWHRLTCPLTDERGAVARLIAVNLPVSHDGKLIE